MNKQTFIYLLCLMISLPAVSDVVSQKEILIDNNTVQVIRLTYPPGTESGMHTHVHPNRVVYVIKGGKLELIPDNKNEQSRIVHIQEGMAMFVPGNTHNVKNIGDTTVVLIETEIK